MGRLKELVSVLEEAVFPRFCVRCSREGDLLCGDCFVSWVPTVPHAVCFVCAASSPYGFACVGCREELLPDSVQSAFVYADPVFRELLHAWKYFYDDSAWKLLQRKFGLYLVQLEPFLQFQKIDAIAYVPLHAQRLCERGFDQSRLIAEHLGAAFSLPVVESCVRVRSTGRQVERSDQARKLEMENSPFLVCSDFSSKRCLLVDDVWTTGATASAAARALKRSGVKRVHVFSLGRG